MPVFKTKWYFFMLTLCLCALFVRLGFWQLHRADEKKQLQSAFHTRTQLPALSLPELMQHKKDILYYPVKATGQYDNAHTVLLDNKIQNHQAGYEVLTPLKIPNDPRLLFINRGWIRADANRNILPSIPDITGEQTITGLVYQTPGKSFILGDTIESQNHWPLRLQKLDTGALEQKLHHPVYAFILLASPDATGHYFVRNWQLHLNELSPDKHIGYAVQWFSFAAVLMIIFLALNIRKRILPK